MRGLALLLLGAACSNAPASSYVGKPCGISGSTECGGGTTCMAQVDILPNLEGGAGCSAMNQACTITCATDADCTQAFGAGFRCETRCPIVAQNQCVAK